MARCLPRRCEAKLRCEPAFQHLRPCSVSSPDALGERLRAHPVGAGRAQGGFAVGDLSDRGQRPELAPDYPRCKAITTRTPMLVASVTTGQDACPVTAKRTSHPA